MAVNQKNAMLVYVRKSKYTGAKEDRNIAEEVCSLKGAERGSGKWRTFLIPRKELKDIMSAESYVDSVFRKWTMPWLDGGIRVLPSENFMGFRRDFREALDAHAKAVETFVTERYPEIAKKAEASQRLGHLLDGQRMPTPEEVRDRFGIIHQILPMPEAGDLRLGRDEEEVKEIEAMAAKAIEDNNKRAVGSVWQALADHVEKLAEKLSDTDKKITDKVIGNLIDLCYEIPRRNITNDPELEAMQKEVVQKLCTLQTDTIKEDKKARKDAANAAKDVLEKLKKYTAL